MKEFIFVCFFIAVIHCWSGHEFKMPKDVVYSSELAFLTKTGIPNSARDIYDAAYSQGSLCDSCCTAKGYLLFAKYGVDELVIFLPDERASNKYSFGRLQAVVGKLIRGAENTFFNVKQQAREYTILVPMRDQEKNSHEIRKWSLKVLPVQIEYRKLPLGKLKEDNGIPFFYKTKKYLINYIDDWDVDIRRVAAIKQSE